VHQLTTQYRMHPIIAAFPSRAFYDDLLRNGCGAAERIPCGHLPWPREGRAPIMFVHVNDAEAARPANGTSWMNEAEARVAIEHVRKLIKDSGGSVSSSDVGVISPYAQQRGHIEDSLRFYHSLYDVEVDTVERFQSREKDYIVMTGVRSEKMPRGHCPHHRARPNALACSPCDDRCAKACQGRLGFVADWRRLNVAITRARRGLIIVGNERTLRVSPHWNALLDYIQDAGAITRVDAPTLHMQGMGAWTGPVRTF
jgi:regulator of nonsense transcripts 1